MLLDCKTKNSISPMKEIQNKIVVVDIDGTIAKVGDRLKHLQESPKNWDKFYERCNEDEPIQNIIELVKTLGMKYEIVFLTGRRESLREKTLSWVWRKFNIDELKIFRFDLLMRPDGDFRHDTKVKLEQFLKMGYKVEDIYLVLEDRNSMVKMWRDLGVTCLQVAEGDF